LDHFALRIAGLTVRVEARTSALRFRVEGPSRDFLVQDGPADLVLGASLRPLEETIEGALLFDSGGPWMLHQSGGRRVYRVFDRRVALHPYTEVRLDEGGTTGDLFLDPRLLVPRVAVDPLAFPLDELLFLDSSRVTEESSFMPAAWWTHRDVGISSPGIPATGRRPWRGSGKRFRGRPS